MLTGTNFSVCNRILVAGRWFNPEFQEYYSDWKSLQEPNGTDCWADFPYIRLLTDTIEIFEPTTYTNVQFVNIPLQRSSDFTQTAGMQIVLSSTSTSTYGCV